MRSGLVRKPIKAHKGTIVDGQIVYEKDDVESTTSTPKESAPVATPTTSLLLLLVHLVESRQRVRVEEPHDAAQCSACRIAHREGGNACVVVMISSLGRR